MKNSIIGVGVVVLVVVVLGLYNRPAKVEGIKLGTLFMLSGDAAVWGENAKKGVDLAIEDFKLDNPGIEVAVLHEDTRSDPKTAISAFKKLHEIENVDGVVGPLFLVEMTALAPVVAQTNVPVVSPVYAPLSARPNPKNPLPLWIDPAVEVERLARSMWDEGIRSVAIISSNDPWEVAGYEAFIQSFESLGGTITERQIVGTLVSDIRSQILKMVNTKPDAVFTSSFYQFINTTKTLSLYKYKGRVFGLEIDNYLANETKGYSDGVQFVAPDFYTSDFVSRYEAKYGEKPSIPAGQAYDNTTVLLNLFKKHGTKDKVLKAMEDLKEWDGVSGKIEITEDNKVMLPTALFEIRSGEILKLKDLK